MKRCPTCQRTYNDDSLRFCLQDGTTLLSISDASASFDPDATLHLAAPGSTSDQPTEVYNPRAAPTVASPQPAPATTPQQRLDTRETTQSAVAAAPATAAAPPSSSSRSLMAGVIAIVLLLLALVGIGVALLLRGSPESNRNAANVDTTNNNNANRNTNTNVNTNNNANSNANGSASPVPTTNNSAPPVNTGSENRNVPVTQDTASSVEAKILRDTPLTGRDLAGLIPSELRRLRNTVYARHGRTFETPELQRYFNTRPWYRPRSDYSDQQLTPTDRANIALIQAAE